MKRASISLASIAALLSGVSGLAHTAARSVSSPNCFPFGAEAKLNANLEPPRVSREEWRCPQSDFYGFLGFSFPFQFTNEDFEVSSISSHMQQMKRQFGATMIRMYIPESYTTQLWENVLEAAILNNMGVVVQVAFPISGNDVCVYRTNTTQQCRCILCILTSPPALMGEGSRDYSVRNPCE
jgi:hypothetical protein